MDPLKVALLVIVGIIALVLVLKVIVAIGAALFWPLVLVGIGVAVGIWYADRKRDSTSQ
jgi:uncharacterized membrane protein